MTLIAQLIIAFGLLNVWIVRAKKQTAYRGGCATTIIEEFKEYGLPVWFCYLIGFLKISSALMLILGIWIPSLVQPASGLVSVLMLGAVSMHAKIKDPIQKALPAGLMLLLSLYVLCGSL